MARTSRTERSCIGQGRRGINMDVMHAGVRCVVLLHGKPEGMDPKRKRIEQTYAQAASRAARASLPPYCQAPPDCMPAEKPPQQRRRRCARTGLRQRRQLSPREHRCDCRSPFKAGFGVVSSRRLQNLIYSKELRMGDALHTHAREMEGINQAAARQGGRTPRRSSSAAAAACTAHSRCAFRW